MVVICAGTSGYHAVVDLRYLWMRQKRLQGSHFANDEQSYAFNHLVPAASGSMPREDVQIRSKSANAIRSCMRTARRRAKWWRWSAPPKQASRISPL